MESAGVPRKVRFKRKGKLWLSHKCTPSVDELAEFESGLLKMVHNIEFRPVRNNFLSKLKEDLKVNNNTKEGLVNADKSANNYKMNKNAYNNYLTENITKTYKKQQKYG